MLIVPVLRDNYSYLLVDRGRAIAVDPGEAAPVIAALEVNDLELVAVLATHHHADHVGGIGELRALLPRLSVFGSEPDRIPEVTHPVAPGAKIEVLGVTGEVLDVHCHTRGHVAYRFGDVLFTGDTLFAGGCGRFFEGDARDMRAAFDTLLALPLGTQIFCGHEYTVKNLEFALTIEPDNRAIAAKLEDARARRALGQPTVPTTLAEELTYNPFLRSSRPELCEAVARKTEERPRDGVETLAALRRLKDQFT